MSQVKAVFYLPLKDSDGRDLKAEIAEVEDEIYACFSAFTCMGYVKGAWQMADATQALDTSVVYALVLDDSDLDKLETLLLQFKAKTQQEALYLEIQRQVDVRFI